MNAVDEVALEQVGQTIADKYRLLSLLGAGGMGAVYEAEHVFTKRRVAVKRMHHGIAKSKLAAERFVRESQAPSSIGHPGIVQVLDGGFEADGSLYLVLELLEGVSLREALEEEALDPPNVVQVTIELLEALAAAHDKGFIHRDIKPDNIFLANDGRGGVTVKLLDFGIASVRDTEGDVKLTQTGAVLGTPLYMSPEQAKGLRVDARSDLWAVGALLYRALSGASPFSGESYNALIVSIVTQDHTPLVERNPELPDALLAVVEGALQKNAATRFQSAGEMLEAMRAVRFDGENKPRPSLQPMRSQRPPKVPKPEEPIEATRVRRKAPRDAKEQSVSDDSLFGMGSLPKSDALPTMTAAAPAPLPVARPRPPRPAYTPAPQEESSGLITKLMLVAGVLALGMTLFFLLRPKPHVQPAPLAAAPAEELATQLPTPTPMAGAHAVQPLAAAQPMAEPSAPTEPGAQPKPIQAPTPTPEPQPTAASGLPPEAVTAVLATQQVPMQACLEETVVAQMMAGNAGKKPLRLDIELHIAPSGRVAQVKATGDVPPTLERCVRERLERAVFPSAAGPTAFRYPLIFQSTIVGN